jgi:hypothetical protein
MFERFTERARRVIFFGRFEAGKLGASWIETEHLLLALMKEDEVLPHELHLQAKEAIRTRIEEQRVTASIPLSADLPLSRDSQHALHFAAEESKKMHHKSIDSGHLVLGLLRVDCLATRLLREHGIEYQNFRQSMSPPIPDKPAGAISFELAVPLLRPTVQRLQGLIDGTFPQLAGYSEADSGKFLKRKPWTRKEAVGHLVDYASSHQQWFARALTEPSIAVLSYPPDDWVAAQHYRNFSWPDLMDLWSLLNELIIHVLTRTPEEKLNTPCRIGVESPIPLSNLATRYADHCEDVIGQILSHL